MSTIATPLPETTAAWTLPYRGKVGMACLIFAESAIFTIFVVAYLFYAREKSHRADSPRSPGNAHLFHRLFIVEQSDDPLCGKILERGRRGAFLLLWLLTIVLGALFLYGTGQEWHRLIYEHGLTISTNLFGTTYYSLVGLHASHVTAGLIMLIIVLFFGLAGRVGPEQSARVDVLSLYWHFVDAVWVVVFTVVYVLGR
jgi:cytochrome c oxidase subunit 3/cytochrome o ubiquinol oxidase subunit 3